MDDQKRSSNATLLERMKTAGLWFHAKKVRPIWVTRLEKAELIETLEGIESVPAGTYLCRGEAGDVWPQAEERLTARYNLTDDIDEQGWRRCDPKVDHAGVIAAQVPYPFHVHAEWGLLTGKEGDFLVKNYEDRDQDEPDDLWIVDQTLFKATYERVAT